MQKNYRKLPILVRNTYFLVDAGTNNGIPDDIHEGTLTNFTFRGGKNWHSKLIDNNFEPIVSAFAYMNNDLPNANQVKVQPISF